MPEWLLEILGWEVAEGVETNPIIRINQGENALDYVMHIIKQAGENGASKFRLTRGDMVDDPKLKRYLSGDD